MRIRLHHKYVPVNEFISDGLRKTSYLRTTEKLDCFIWPKKEDSVNTDTIIKFRLDDGTEMSIGIPMYTIDMTSPVATEVIKRMYNNDILTKGIEELAWHIENYYADIGIKMERTDIYMTGFGEEEDGVQ